MTGCRIWVARITGGLFSATIAATLIVPLVRMPAVVFLLLLFLTCVTGGLAVITLPGSAWNGLLLCAGMLLVPNLWSWPPETLVLASDSLATRLTYLAFLLLLSGLSMLPFAFARLLWTHDLTCVMTLLMGTLVTWSMIVLTLHMSQAAFFDLENQSIATLVHWMSLLGMPILLLVAAALMAVVNLVRLLYQEFRV